MGYKDYVVHYDIYGRPIFNNIKRSNSYSNRKIHQFDNHKKRVNVIDRDKFRNKNIVDVDKIISFENSGNNNYTSERINIYSKNLSRKNNNNSNFNLSLNKSLNKNLENTIDNNK